MASLPESLTLIDTSSDTFLSNLFSSNSGSSVIPQTLEELKAKMANLYPAFENQLEMIRDMYSSFWEFLSLEEFRNIVCESLEEDSDSRLHPEIEHM